MDKKSQSCCVIGSTQLAINCSLILLKHGFEIKQIFTDDDTFSNWADDISVHQDIIDAMRKFNNDGFDYLFSIANDTLVPATFLKNIRNISINYHNGPLPRYAGTNAVNWAIINDEQTHGITWHVMSEEFDSGIILEKEEFMIEDNDTLFDVNWKCMQAAEKSLHRLCEALNKKMYTPNSRSSLMYFALEKKPTPFCLLPFNLEAKDVYNFFRGCFHFRNQPNSVNELGVPKILLPAPYNKLLIVSDMSISSKHTDHCAGSVVNVGETLLVSVANYSLIEIKGLMELDGTNLTEPFSLIFPSLAGKNLMFNTCPEMWNISNLTGKNDRRWSKYIAKLKRAVQISGATPLTWPYFSVFVTSSSYEVQPSPLSINLFSFPDKIMDSLGNLFPASSLKAISLATYTSFLLAMSSACSSGYCDVLIRPVPKDYENFLLGCIPVLLEYDQNMTLYQLIETNCKAIAKVSSNAEHKYISSDLYCRYPVQRLKSCITLALTSDIKHSDIVSGNLIIACTGNESVSLSAHFLQTDFHPSSFSSVEEDFLCFLHGFLKQPNCCVGSLPVCSEEMQLNLQKCSTLNGPSTQVTNPTLHIPFFQIADKYPHKVAVIDEYGQYTYGELKKRANEIAVNIGHSNDVRVALLVERSWEFIASMMAVLLTGATFVPIEPGFPQKYIQFVVNDSNCQVLIADVITEKVQQIICTKHLYLMSIQSDAHQDMPTKQLHHCINFQEAAILYTSGTTGKPKGVRLTHIGLSNVLEAVMKSISYCDSEMASDYVLHSSSTTFDSFFLETFIPLWSGGTIIIHPTNPLQQTRCSGLLKYVNYLHTQPVKLSFFEPKCFKSINRLTFGGEAPTMGLLLPWLKVCSNAWNIYGPTETSVITTAARITDKIHIGKCIQNAQLQILTPSMQNVPRGVLGELHIGGIGVALGYTDNVQTQQKFWKKNTVAYYKTGDLVYLDDEEVLNFVGRIPKDRQVKIGGVRIELLGIENIIQQQQGVKFARVIKDKQIGRTDMLVAYVCPESVDCTSLKSCLGKLLPVQTIPTLIIPVHEKELKFSTSGKLQWKQTKCERVPCTKSTSPPSTDIERKVLSLYNQCLGLQDSENFGLNDKLLEFGGDSVTILYLVGKLRSALNWCVFPSDVTEFTPSQLISKYYKDEHCPTFESTVTVDDRNTICGSEEALLSMDHKALGPTYNIPYTFKISGDSVSCADLTYSLNRALGYITPSFYSESESDCNEVVHVDLSAFSFEKSQECALQMSQRNALIPINLKKSPHRCILFYIGKGCYILSLVIHHISFDFTSWKIFRRILENTFTYSAIESSELDTLHAGSPEDYVCNNEHLMFWKEQMKDCQLFVKLPSTYERKGARLFVGKRLNFRLKCDNHIITKFCQGINIDPSVLFLSVYGLLIHWISKESMFGIGVNVSQRYNAKLKQKIGFLTNTVICKFTEQALVGRYIDLLQHIQTWQERAVYHSSVSLFEIIECTQRYHLGTQNYLPQFLYNYIPDHTEPSLSLGKHTEAEFIDMPTRTSKAELVLDVNHDGKYYNIVWEYCTSLYSDEYVNDLNSCFCNFITSILRGIFESVESFKMEIPSTLCPHRSSFQSFTTEKPSTTVKFRDGIELNFYQKQLLDEELQPVDHLPGGLHASAFVSVCNTVSVQTVESALQVILLKSRFLSSTIKMKKDSSYLTEHGNQVFRVTQEDVSEKDEAIIKLREHMWPFDVFSGPLLRFTLVHNTLSSKKYLIVTIHQILMNEHSLVYFCKQIGTLLKQTSELQSFRNPCNIHHPDKCEMDFWTQNMAKHNQPSLFSLEYNYCSPCVVFETISGALNINFENPDDLIIYYCSFTAVLLWKLQKPSAIQFCLLNYQQSMHSNCYCASDQLYPITINIDLSEAKSLNALWNLIRDYIKHSSKYHLPCYWYLQEQISPCSSFTNPYHDVLLIVSDQSISGSDEEDTVFPRPFKINLHVNTFKKKIFLKTMLNGQQTFTTQTCFKECLRLFSEVKLDSLADKSVSTEPFLCSLSNVMEFDGYECNDLRSMIQQRLLLHPHSILYTDIARGTSKLCTDVPCIVTAHEFHNQVIAVSQQLQTIVVDQASTIVAIVTNGGYEMPISMVAAIYCRCAFFIIQLVDDNSLFDRIKQVHATVVLYDRFHISTVEKIAKKFPQLQSLYVSTFNAPVNKSDLFIKKDVCANLCAYVVFTSGSTGNPKPIKISEKSVCNFLAWHSQQFALDHDLNWIQFAHPHFDAVVVEVMGQLLLKNNLVLIDFANRLSQSYVTKVLRRYHINCLHTTPTILSQLIHTRSSNSYVMWTFEMLPELLHVFSGGERVTLDLYNKFLQRFHYRTSFHNWGGPAEACMAFAHCEFKNLPTFSSLPMGAPIANTSVTILSVSNQLPLPKGMIGEISVSGLPVCKEFLKTSELFIDNNNHCWYLTGDIGYINSQDQVVVLARKDKQIKVNSERMNIDGIREMILRLKLSGVVDVIVEVIKTHSKNELICFPVVTKVSELTKDYLQEQLMLMLPKQFLPKVVQCFHIDQIPKLVSGKTDYRKLLKIAYASKATSRESSISKASSIVDILLECIRIALPHASQLDDSVLLHKSLDTLGMNSLHKSQFHQLILERNFKIGISSILLSNTIVELVQHVVRGSTESIPDRKLRICDSVFDSDRVVIIAMEVNVPGAKSEEELWKLVEDNKDAVSHDLPNLLDSNDPRYVGSRGVISEYEYFDAQLFNIHNDEAKLMDPQLRLLLQAVWTSLEKAGYDPIKFSKVGKIGCFASVHFPKYMVHCIHNLERNNADDIVWGNLRDNVALRIGRCLDFRGPCVTFANNCASMAFALHFARNSLLQKECDIAIVAAATVSAKRTGYIYNERDIYSPDGHCRPFSMSANGTVMSDGLVVFALRRLCDAVASNDDIICIVANTAIGSDGALTESKLYVPAVTGQVETLMKVLEGMPSSTVELIEAHGTATPVGDEIEIESLKSVFKGVEGPLILGSIKGNIGHLGVASAGPSIVKAALALKKRKFPPSLTNGQLAYGLEKSNFCCLDSVMCWKSKSSVMPRRALVHSVGVLGANSGIILEEYVKTSSTKCKVQELALSTFVPVCMSAQSEWSLRRLYERVIQYVLKNPDVQVADLAYSLNYGRRDLPIRFTKVVSNTKELTDSVINNISFNTYPVNNNICITFSGQGTFVSITAFCVYSKCIPEFKNTVSEYCCILSSLYPQHFPHDLARVLTTGNSENVSIDLHKPVLQHLLTVVFHLGIYYALQHYGVNASIVMGHSLGEYTAACVSGFLTSEELFHIVYKRAMNLEKGPRGLMLAVHLSGEECVLKYLCQYPSLEIACYNSSHYCVVSGPTKDIELLYIKLSSENVRSKILETMQIAYHHSNLNKVEVPEMKCCKCSSIPMISTLKYLKNQLLPINSKLHANHWKTHLVTSVDFRQALLTLNKHYQDHLRIIEIGLVECLKMFSCRVNETHIWCKLVGGKTSEDVMSFLSEIWKLGIPIELFRLPVFYGARRCILPTYVFDVKRYWIDDVDTTQVKDSLVSVSHRIPLNNYHDQIPAGEVINTKDDILSFIKEIIGAEYDEQLPPESLVLRRLCDKVMDKYGIEISEILEQDFLTPESLACHIESRIEGLDDDQFHYDSPIKDLSFSGKCSSKPSIFIVHAIAGEKFSFQPLASLLSQSYKVYGLYSSHALRNLSTVQDIAKFYLDSMIKIQDIGPFIIGGYSYGAWIAHSIDYWKKEGNLLHNCS